MYKVQSEDSPNSHESLTCILASEQYYNSLIQAQGGSSMARNRLVLLTVLLGLASLIDALQACNRERSRLARSIIQKVCSSS